MIATAIRIAVAVGLGGMAGLLGGLFGVGGGFLVIPLLGFFYGMDQQTAQGTVLIMVVPNVVWAFSRYRRRFGIDLRMAATIAGSALIATYPTARLATGRRAANQPDSKSMIRNHFSGMQKARDLSVVTGQHLSRSPQPTWLLTAYQPLLRRQALSVSWLRASYCSARVIRLRRSIGSKAVGFV